MTSLESESGGVEENLGSVGERESTVAKILSLLLVLENLSGLSLVEGRLFEDLSNDGSGRVGSHGVGKGEGDVGDEADFPLGELKVSTVDEVGDETGDVVHERGGGLESGVGVDFSDRDEDDGGRELSGLNLHRGEVGSIAVGLSDFSESLDGLGDDTSSLGIGDVALDLDETGEKFREERSNGVFVVDELGHVVLCMSRESATCETNARGKTDDNDGDLSDGGSELLGQSSREERSHEGESGRVDLGDERGGSEELNRGGNFLDGVDEGRDEGGDELFDILVGDESTELGEGSSGGLLDVGFGICRARQKKQVEQRSGVRTPDGIDHDGNDIGHSSGALIRCSGDEEIHDFETSSLDLPFTGGLDLLEEDGEENEGGPRGGGGDDGLDGVDGGDSNGSDLVGKGFRDHQLHQLFEEERLDGVSDTLLNEDAQQLARAFSGNRVLLVGQSLFDGSSETESDERLRTLELDEVDELDGGLLSLDTRGGGEDDVDVDGRVGRSWDGSVFSLDRCWVDFDGRGDGGGRSRHRCWH